MPPIHPDLAYEDLLRLLEAGDAASPLEIGAEEP